jgi:Flp pilus assembly protein TadG
MRLTRTIVREFQRDRRGSVASIFAIAAPVLLMFAGGVADYTQALMQRQQLQIAIDSATLAAAKELGLADARRENVNAVVEAMVLHNIASKGGSGAAPTLTTQVATEPLEIAVVARQLTQPYFGSAFGLLPTQLEVTSVARIVGRPNICVLALDPQSKGTISLEKNARVTGNNCAVFSNSTHKNGIKSKNSASLTASTICTAGGRDGGPGNFSPEPIVDCPTFDDPLLGRPEPTIGACGPSTLNMVTSSATLRPGTFCGGLTIKKGAQVKLDPGIYIIKDGPLVVEDAAKLSGSGVGFYLVGTGAVVTLNSGSSIDLAAPTAGAMAGLLLFESRKQPTTGLHQILSDDARNLLGTIYVSRGRLHIDANAPIADKSAYTAIVARMLTLYGGPNLVLNSNYTLTDVPVPEGIKGAGQPAVLIK